MQRFRKTFAWLSIASVSAASFCGDSTSAAPQKDIPCTESKVVEQSCANLNWVNAEQGKPFTAERVVQSVISSVPSIEQTEVLARDTTGRIREEFHFFKVQGVVSSSHPILALGGTPSSHHDLNTDVSLVTENSVVKDTSFVRTGELAISILDCFGGKRIQLTPSTQTAIVQEPCAPLPIFQPTGQPYSYKLARFLKTSSYPDATVEDLGYKQLQTLQARGIRITWLGNEKAGDWKGKPVKVWEEWMSDELGVTLLWSYSDLRREVENRETLLNIRREEPDASLFTVPSGYKTTSWKQITLKSR
jgi:hypothetical protein